MIQVWGCGFRRIVMNCYFAPMEGITGYCFRRVHHRYYPGVDVYYAPFVGANHTHSFSGREKRDIDPANNAGIPTVPQVLSNSAGDFLWAVGEMEERGYGEVNLNLGCPASTVVSHHRGAGMLEDPARLDRFLEEVFDGLGRRGSKARISVKSRIGFADPAEFPAILEVFTRYPLAKLILHPRVREEYYQGSVHEDAFALAAEAAEKAGIPLVWNGEVKSSGDAACIEKAFPGIEGIMIGRGLLINPGLCEELPDGLKADDRNRPEEPASQGCGTGEDRIRTLRRFHSDLIDAYRSELSGETSVLYKMKELIYWIGQSFEGSGRFVMKARHAGSVIEYKSITEQMFREAALKSEDSRRQ